LDSNFPTAVRQGRSELCDSSICAASVLSSAICHRSDSGFARGHNSFSAEFVGASSTTRDSNHNPHLQCVCSRLSHNGGVLLIVRRVSGHKSQNHGEQP